MGSSAVNPGILTNTNKLIQTADDETTNPGVPAQSKASKTRRRESDDDENRPGKKRKTAGLRNVKELFKSFCESSKTVPTATPATASESIGSVSPAAGAIPSSKPATVEHSTLIELYDELTAGCEQIYALDMKFIEEASRLRKDPGFAAIGK